MTEQLGRANYEAHAKAMGGRPNWDRLSAQAKQAWVAAAGAVARMVNPEMPAEDFADEDLTLA